MSFCDACMLSFLDFVGFDVDFSMLERTLRHLKLTRHRGVHWNFPLFLSFSRVSLIYLFVIRIITIGASQLSRIVELRFLDSPLQLFFSLSCFRNSRPHFGPQILRSGSCLHFCTPLSGPQISVGRSFVQYCELRETGP